MAFTGLAPLLQVYDMHRAVAFYRDTLGFGLIQTSAAEPGADFGWCLLGHGDVQIMLNTAFDPEEQPQTEPPRPEDPRTVALFVWCSDADAVYARIRDRGWPVEPPVDAPYGMRQVYVRDPDGFEICFQHPATRD